jgi:hypothetical protein
MADKYELQDRIDKALDIAWKASKTEDAHHKQWLIDQMFRVLVSDPKSYQVMISYYNSMKDEDDWDTGIAP